MRLRSFPAEISLLDVFLRVVPRTTGVSHQKTQDNAGKRSSGKESAKSMGADEDADQDRSDNRRDAGDDHPLQGGRGGDVDTSVRIGRSRSFHDTGNLSELSPDLVDHVECGFTDRCHRERCQQAGNHPAEEDTRNHVCLCQVEGKRFKSGEGLDRCGVGGEHGQGCKCRGTDGEPFTDRGGGVSDRVQAIRDFPDMRGHVSLLGNTAGIIGNRTVAVHGHGHSNCAQHADTGNGNTVETAGDV
ncbi:MAG: hypothetical protein A4E74_01370 [Syntrophus sp. PtaB.Bin075]|nr:MAG: hypothetical protein A4E74_01370 [Syntrophus sp. PtaB.Bin075]